MLASVKLPFTLNNNLAFDGESVAWKIPLETLLPKVIDGLVGVCISEHKHNNMRPDLIGKRESAYSQCYTKMQLLLARQGIK